MAFIDQNLALTCPSQPKTLVKRWSKALSTWLTHAGFDPHAVQEHFDTVNIDELQIQTLGFGNFAKQACWFLFRGRIAVAWISFKLMVFVVFSCIVESVCRLFHTHDPCPDLANCFANVIHTRACPGRRRKPQHVRRILSELKPYGVVIPQDKSHKAAMGWHIHSYWQALYCNFVLDTQHYEVLWAWTPQDLVFEQYIKHLDHVPPVFQRSASYWQVPKVARAYLTVKRKCFQTGIGLYCTKSHAHFREIIANARDPLKRPLRTLSRLWQVAFNQSGRPSWELWKMSNAVPELKRIHSELTQHVIPDMTRKRCHAEKAGFECIVADISQLFKDVEPLSVVTAATRLAEFCRLRLFVAGISLFPGLEAILGENTGSM